MQKSNLYKSKYIDKKKSNTPTCFDLFCGAGGLSLGFTQAGGIPIAAVDNDQMSMETYKNMFPHCDNLHVGKIEDWKPQIKDSSVDVIIGGPPCQGFSLARGLRFVDDPRNHLYKEFVRIVNEFKPKWFVMENVPGITNIGNGVILQQIYEDFSKIGYWIECKVINMANFGVPQTRKRAIFVGSKVANSFDWLTPTHKPINKIIETNLFEKDLPYLSVESALGDLPYPMGNYFSHRANSQMRGPRNRCVKTDPAFTLRVRGDEFAICDKPANGAFIPEPVPEINFVYRPIKNNFQELMREIPPPWIKNYESIITVDEPKPKLNYSRRLAVREQARLQTFPDWFNFSGSNYAKGRQIGNAVPPLFAKQLFEKIISQLNN